MSSVAETQVSQCGNVGFSIGSRTVHVGKRRNVFGSLLFPLGSLQNIIRDIVSPKFFKLYNEQIVKISFMFDKIAFYSAI